jgi:magnesium-transporting ATPase (P-type)
LLTILLVWDNDFWLQAALVMLSHGIIDTLKLTFQKQNTKRIWFFTDQLLHIISIILIWWFTTRATINFGFLDQKEFWKPLAAVLVLTYPASIFIKVLIAKWTPNQSTSITQAAETSLQSAGKYIGIMERLLIFVFVYTNHFEAIGFLLGAKSIFRFGDLKEGNELKLTEYILIGTFLSFGIAIVISLIATT